MSLTFRARDFLIKLKRTYIMGILNVTPDSFSDGNKYFCKDKAVQHAECMVEQGADIIDIGGQSTRPGYTCISEKEEWDRIKDIIPLIRKKVDVPISVDTFYSSVAERAIKNGADIINDVTGFSDKDMFDIVKRTSCGCIITSNTSLENTPNFFSSVLDQAENLKIPSQNICFDPGIGFSKTYEQNLKMLSNVKKYCPDGHAILVGASRKSVTGIACSNPEPKKRFPATITAHTFSVIGGANILRVHDIWQSVQAAKMADELMKYKE